MPGLARRVEIKAGDILVVEADPENIESVLGSMGLEYLGTGVAALEDEDLTLSEVVVPESSRLRGRSTASFKLLYRYGVALVGVSRQGRRFRDNVRQLEIMPGDVLLLLGSEERLGDVIGRLGLLPLKDRGQRVIQRDKAWLAVGLFRRGHCRRQRRARVSAGRARLCRRRLRVAEHRAGAQPV